VFPQAGYASDGVQCLGCPSQTTCDASGAAACQGECDLGTRGTCASGWVRCEQACPVSGADPNAVALRAPYLLSPPGASCAPYFDCGLGYYFALQLEGGPSCAPCDANMLPDGAVWVTPGLSFNDPLSCQWECDRGVTTGPSCAALARERPMNEAGFYGPDATTQTSCGPGRTSEAGTALADEDCLACPALPAVFGEWTVFGVRASLCQWHCSVGTQRGPACVGALQCGEPGRLPSDGGCATAAIPWQPAGYAKTGVEGFDWTPPAPVVPAPPSATMRRLLAHGPAGVNATGRRLLQTMTTLASKAPFLMQGLLIDTATDPRSTVLAVTMQWGVSYRNWVVDSATKAWVLAPAALCSLTTGVLGGQPYAFGAMCNRSLLVWVGLQAANDGSGVLIGQPQPGWADGFRTQALFGSELYVAFSARTGTLFVLDRWNCLLREVHIPAVGAYTTRAYTVYGLTAKFLIAGNPQPRCYGAGSLSAPRAFFAGDAGAGEAWLFVDDAGVRQLTPETREVGLSVPATEFPAGLTPAGVTWAEPQNGAATGVWVAWGTTVRAYRAAAEPCPTGWTSLAGGACTVGCPWASTGGTFNYVRADGACTRCLDQGALGCGLGQRFVLCNATAASWCEACPALPAGVVYTMAGSCDGLARLPPCVAGAYLTGWYCRPCPVYTATQLGGAVRVEQCKCLAGFRRVDGECRSQTLYTYPAGGLCAAQACPLPRNGTLLSAATCAWACAVGTYRLTTAGFADACQPCQGLPAGARYFTTAGDDDAPLSCEFA